MYSVALLESQVTLELPHLGMALLHSDLKRRGDVDVRAARVGVDNTAAALDFLEEGQFDLVAIDCRFPVVFPSRIKERLPRCQVVVGGLGYYNMLTKGRADFAVCGPGRLALNRLVDTLTGRNGTRLTDVPNLFYWVERPTSGAGPGGGPIDYSGLDAGYDLKSEIEPFTPDFDFRLVGMETPERLAQSSGIAPPAVVAEFGCPHKGYALSDKLPRPDLEPAEAVFTARGRQKIMSIMNERWKGGCSFCVYQRAPLQPVGETVALLLHQMNHLQRTQGFTAFSVQSEAPFRFLLQLLARIIDSDLEVRHLFIRGRAASFHRHRHLLEKAVALAKTGKITLVSWQIGYESFCQSQLDLYNKGTSSEVNLSVLQFNHDLQRRNPEHFHDLNSTHGMILFNPWTTFPELKYDFDVLRRYMPERLVQSPVVGSTLELFDPFLPLYQKARLEGLLRRNDLGTDDFRMADPAMEVVRRVIRDVLLRIDRHLPAALRNEVGLFAPVIGSIFGHCLDKLEARYFDAAAPDRAWREQPGKERTSEAIRHRVEDFLSEEGRRIEEKIDSRVHFAHAVHELLFYAEQEHAASSGDATVELGPEELGREIRALQEDFAGTSGPWDFEVRNYERRAVVIDRTRDEMTPMDRVMYTLVQIKVQRLDMGEILETVGRRCGPCGGLIVDRARKVRDFLAASAAC